MTLLTAKAANQHYGQQPGCKPYSHAHSLLERMERNGYTIHDCYGCKAVTAEDIEAFAVAIQTPKVREIKNTWTDERDRKLPQREKDLKVLRRLARQYGVLGK